MEIAKKQQCPATDIDITFNGTICNPTHCLSELRLSPGSTLKVSIQPKATIILRYLSQEYTVSSPLDKTVWDVISVLAEKIELNASFIRVIFRGRELSIDSPINTLGLGRNDVFDIQQVIDGGTF